MDPPSRSTAANDELRQSRPGAADENEYAAFAAQLAARSEKFRAGAGPPPPPLGTPAEQQTGRYGLSQLGGARPGRMWAGGLLLAALSIGVFAIWDGTDPPGAPSSPPAPVAPKERPKAEQPRAVEPPKAERPRAPPPKADPPKAEAPKSGNVDNIVKDILSPKLSQPSAPSDPRQPAPAQAKTPAAAQPPSLTQAEIREMQSRLKGAGFDPGPIDGVVGARTAAAVRKYGETRALRNAEPTKDLLTRLRSEPPQAAELGGR